MNSKLRALLLVAGLVSLTSCYVYDPYYHGYVVPGQSTAQTYDRAWGAAAGALHDQGVQITSEDRAGGLIQGRRGGMTVTARVITQADGRVRVEFNTAGASEDPGLPGRVSEAYERRMGR
jgi:hypothetical protein